MGRLASLVVCAAIAVPAAASADVFKLYGEVGGGGLYGKGLAGDMWKSMMAEQIANVMAERGGVGIATRVLGDYYKEGDRKVAVVGVDGGPQKQALDARNMLSRAMIQEFERAVMAGHDGGADGADRT